MRWRDHIGCTHFLIDLIDLYYISCNDIFELNEIISSNSRLMIDDHRVTIIWLFSTKLILSKSVKRKNPRQKQNIHIFIFHSSTMKDMEVMKLPSYRFNFRRFIYIRCTNSYSQRSPLKIIIYMCMRVQNVCKEIPKKINN